MYLIDSSNLTLVEVTSHKQARYAILSHRWGLPSVEVSFQEMRQPERSKETLSKPGYQKISKICEIAASDPYNLSYVWVDTCCIDKSSSAELSESINSMFRWYQAADMCFAYLDDVTGFDLTSFKSSKWFERGWTLQELLAPKDVRFFDKYWTPLGTKSGPIGSLSSAISDRTGIPEYILCDPDRISDVPVAQRLSWAAGRETTREEDMAYSLMGIFDVNLPMLYGEGKKAFIRLQGQILAQSADLSLFLWTDTESKERFSGLLAESPSAFRAMRDVNPEPTFTRRDFSMTNRGIHFTMGIEWDEKTGLWIMPVKHSVNGKMDCVSIYLRRVGWDTYVRARPQEYAVIKTESQYGSFTVVKRLSFRQSTSLYKNAIKISLPRDIVVMNHEPKGSWGPDCQLLFSNPDETFIGYMTFYTKHHSSFTIVFWCHGGDWSVEVIPAKDWSPIQPIFFQHFRDKKSIFMQNISKPILASLPGPMNSTMEILGIESSDSVLRRAVEIRVVENAESSKVWV